MDITRGKIRPKSDGGMGHFWDLAECNSSKMNALFSQNIRKSGEKIVFLTSDWTENMYLGYFDESFRVIRNKMTDLTGFIDGYWEDTFFLFILFYFTFCCLRRVDEDDEAMRRLAPIRPTKWTVESAKRVADSERRATPPAEADERRAAESARLLRISMGF